MAQSRQRRRICAEAALIQPPITRVCACIAVTSDERLDYFGSMVNRAARLKGESRGGNIVLSTEMIESAGPNDQIEGARNFELVQDTGRLRSFDNPITYWRMTKRAVKA